MNFPVFNWLNTELGIKKQDVKFYMDVTSSHMDPNNYYGPSLINEFTSEDDIDFIDKTIKHNIATYIKGFYNFWLENQNGEKITIFDGDKYAENYEADS